MAKHLHSSSDSYHYSPKRRRVDVKRVALSQSSRTGAIDQRLIEGSQQLQQPVTLPLERSFVAESTPIALDDDVLLDEFGKSFFKYRFS